ncbi:MAG: hypothetical protein R3F14_08135 [Polyangiaceae bacterium]
MRRPFTLALACLSLATGSIALLGQGCNPGLNVQDLCGFLKEPNNCYQRFAEGVVHTTDAAGNKAKPKCGVEIIDDGSADDGKGFDVATSGPYAADNQKPTFGAFLARDKLDVCILTGGEGGQIIFDPPLEATAFPPTGFAFKMIDGTGEQCGTGSYASLTSFSLGVDPPKSTGTGTGGGGGAGGAGGTGGGETTSTDTSPITSGTFSITGTEQAEIVDTVCPDGETHKFNLYQLNKCEQYKDILPTAEVEANAGAIGKEGFVRMFVYWPPSVAGSTDGDPLANAKPVKVEYFHCKFLARPSPARTACRTAPRRTSTAGATAQCNAVTGRVASATRTARRGSARRTRWASRSASATAVRGARCCSPTTTRTGSCARAPQGRSACTEAARSTAATAFA